MCWSFAFARYLKIKYAGIFFWSDLQKVKLHLQGRAFQLKVGQLLLQVPFAHLSTYASIAEDINKPKASRAVGSAIGSNPVAFLIPCHRVIRSSGIIGDFHWGMLGHRNLYFEEIELFPAICQHISNMHGF